MSVQGRLHWIKKSADRKTILLKLFQQQSHIMMKYSIYPLIEVQVCAVRPSYDFLKLIII